MREKVDGWPKLTLNTSLRNLLRIAEWLYNHKHLNFWLIGKE